MKLNLDALKDQILEYLQTQGFAVFQGSLRRADCRPAAYWDTRAHPEFQSFLEVARQAGCKIVVFSRVEFAQGMLEDAADQLEDCEMPAEERRGVERRLRDLGGYQGFTCALELAFDCEGREYIYELQAEWYAEFLYLLDEIHSYVPEEEDEGEGDSMGSFFSRN
jgi:hypothetical protein